MTSLFRRSARRIAPLLLAFGLVLSPAASPIARAQAPEEPPAEGSSKGDPVPGYLGAGLLTLLVLFVVGKSARRSDGPTRVRDPEAPGVDGSPGDRLGCRPGGPVPRRAELGLSRPCRGRSPAPPIGRRPARLGRPPGGPTGWSSGPRTNGDWRRSAARPPPCINADRDEIAFINSTTHGIGLIAEGYPWRAGDTVVTAADEYPSNLYPWMNLESSGRRVRQVPSRDGRICPGRPGRRDRPLDAGPGDQPRRVRHGLPQRPGCPGRALPIARRRAVRRRDPGARPVSDRRAARRRSTSWPPTATSGSSAPRAPASSSSARDWIDRLRPIGVGWHSVVGSYNAPVPDFRLKPNAQRWEGGSFTMPGLLTFGASLDLFFEWGLDAVARRIADRAERRPRAGERRPGWSVYGSPREADRSAIVVLERAGR